VNGKFAVFERLESLNTLVNFFMSALAETWGPNAIGVILSGSGTDGAEGITSIKKHGGFTLAQDSSAQFDGMPSSACETGFVDLVGTPEEIVERIVEIAKNACPGGQGERFPLYDQILLEIEKKSEKSFRGYKEGTVIRRIQRQMELNGCVSPAHYLKELQCSPDLVDALQSDIFIHVTNFFRDAKVWSVLQEKVLPHLLLTTNKEVRLWVIGASTGAEAYTYAMLLHKVMEVKKIRLHCSIFATDVSQKVIDHASKGVFTKSELVNVPVAFLEAYFTKHNGIYTVIGVIRKMVVFAVHDVLYDPPFIKMDLVSCRNLLIYFKQEVQTRVLSLFHYALNKDGYLVLGVSETITTEMLQKFGVEDESCKIYSAIGPKSAVVSSLIGSSRLRAVHRVAQEHPVIDAASRDVKSGQGRSELESRVDSTLRRLFVPPSVVFNDLNVIVMTVGKLDQYISLGAQGGAPSLDVLKCARHTGLAALLSIATRRCLAGERNVVFKGFGVPVGEDDERLDDRCQIVFDVSVHHIVISGSNFFLATFIESKTTTVSSSDQEVADVSGILRERFNDMEGELVSTRATLRETVENLEGSFVMSKIFSGF
jgi:two-component system CheB/CheR fusion protein